MNFDVPLLIEPLKSLVFKTDEKTSLLDSVGKQVRLFCTVYDPASGTYRYDYSVFIGTFIGILCVGWVGFNLIREWRYTLKHKS
jgi:protein SCO1/2